LGNSAKSRSAAAVGTAHPGRQSRRTEYPSHRRERNTFTVDCTGSRARHADSVYGNRNHPALQRSVHDSKRRHLSCDRRSHSSPITDAGERSNRPSLGRQHWNVRSRRHCGHVHPRCLTRWHHGKHRHSNGSHERWRTRCVGISDGRSTRSATDEQLCNSHHPHLSTSFLLGTAARAR
jgi:hypothetical protein